MRFRDKRVRFPSAPPISHQAVQTECNMKAWYKSKTVWFGVALFLLGGLELVQQHDYLPDGWAPLVGLIIIVLRAVTREPIG